MAKTKDWGVQWHITADGTAIKQRSKGDEAHQQLYGRHATSRAIQMSELEAMEERLAQFKTFWERMTAVLLYVTWALIAAFVAGIVCLLLGVDQAVWAPLIFISLPLLLIIGLSVSFIARHLRFGSEKFRTDAGFESGEWETLAATEARTMIDAPGTVSGPVFRVENA